MLRHFAVLSGALFLASTWSIAQTTRDFSGTWELDHGQSTATEGTPSTLVITQTPTAVTIEQRGNGQQDTITYPFKPAAEVTAAVATHEPATTRASDQSSKQRDASEPVGARTDGPGGETGIQAAGAEWANGGLDTLAVIVISGKSVTQRTHRTLNASGTEMTVERVLAVQHGYQTGDAGNASRDVYVKRVSAPARR